MKLPVATPAFWPGPALIYDSGGTLKESGPEDDFLVKQSRLIIHPDIASLIAQFGADRQSRLATIQLDDGGDLHIYDIALIQGGEENTIIILAHETPMDRSVLLSLTSTYHRHKELVEISSDLRGSAMLTDVLRS